jgi:serine/threonine protein kinase/Tfp pilus assembly protein PilF
MVFGRYTLVKVLGRGGMGIVWLAHDEELERDVALKFLPDLMIQDRALLDQLKRETKRCLELTHPHIVRIHDFVHDERSGCISMEYVDGETLSNLRTEKEQKVFEPSEIAEWIGQLCDALDYAHRNAKVIHRDLKPANLMVNQRGDLKVADFGIARSLADSATRLTSEQGRSGTLVYMSPQQLNGERGTHLDDIYSLGASIYELLTSKPPFYSGNIDRQICERVAPSMTKRRKELDIEPALVPQVWEDAVAACLAKDPSRRPQSAAEVAQRLQLAPGQTRTRTAAGRISNKKALLVGGIAALSVLALVGLYFGGLKRQTKPVLPAAIPEKSIAVLPFENLSDEKENAYFADGVQDEILTGLARVADLKVISRTSVMQYKTGTKRNLREIAEDLGVAHVLEGSVQRAGGRVRVNAQLIDARTDSHLWAERYDRDVADVFAIESEVAGKIVEQLQAKISPSEKAAIEQKPTADLAAHDLYIRAKTLIATSAFSTPLVESLSEAVPLLDQAIERDPAFALAYYEIAQAHDQLFFAGIGHTPARLAMADAAIQSLTRLLPNSGEAHLALAKHLYWGYLDYDHAREELKLAQKSLPNEPLIFEILGFIDRRQGRWAESTKNLKRAIELDPQNRDFLKQLADSYACLRQYADAERVLDRAIAIAPKDSNTRAYRASIELEWHADPHPLSSTIRAIIAEDSREAQNVAQLWLRLSLCERDFDSASRALAALPIGGCYDDFIPFPRASCEGLVAQMKGDKATVLAAYTTARNEAAKLIADQPDYPEGLCVLGMADAALGNKEDAIRAGRRAVELLPVSKNAIEGALLIEYLALIYTWTGEKDLAFQQLPVAARTPGFLSYGELRLHPRWDSLRGDPRFEKIAASLAPK